jgi:riboflavin synthase alpha subunit
MINEINPDQKEGKVAKAIENQTAKIPSDVFLWASIASMGVSLTLKCLGQKHTALFVGQWASPFLLLGIYNKIVKTEGND